ncbi:aldehyde dehydrogenase (NAD+) [Caloranaerobacter azorensis DSM 13643]|uniref:Aldehyde dehydrogenase n=1 Tax=Caloranaerobacter azorensis DSM 13643 TaxID=1121264 RepID=A0A1M5T2D5_9FIRM|nr:aldehyde dehydrogenase [Caloranaerobacter azorensis]SHH44891.1 aldehyde dehydrogenase (NAD+) [Caloranaerobacter azorensis DSM 13643]
MNEIKELIDRQRKYFERGITLDINFRINMLKVLKSAIIENEKLILRALKEDLNKSDFEGYETEIGIVLDEIGYIIKNLRYWTKPKRVKTPITQFISKSYIYSEPYGVTLIIAPWNYPFQLVMAPLIGSISAGNCSIIKPSEYSPNTSKIISKIISDNFEEEFIAVIEGGIEVNKALLEEKFDYIFFTGSVNVGKIVMEAASKHLTPITLELGGKSPCIVDEDADVELAAKRIVWGKFLNAGQTCVAPDYLYLHKNIKDDFIKNAIKFIKEFFGENPLKSEDYPRIVNIKHFNRLKNLLKDGDVLYGGDFNEEKLYIAPTIIDNITWEDSIMQEEIFGPILPILMFEKLDEVIKIVNIRPKPLALYYFSNNKEKQERVIREISFGGGCINDTIVHLATPYLPFGGVGNSGMGNYHGKASFDTFSHKKSVLKKSNLIDISLRYPPYKNKINLLKKILK